MIFVPALVPRGAVEMVTIDPAVLQDALKQDAASAREAEGNPKT
jgi:hypothetical protein